MTLTMFQAKIYILLEADPYTSMVNWAPADVMEFILTDYINSAMEHAEYDKLEDGSFAGRIPKCEGVIPLRIHYGNARMSCARHLKTGYLWVSN